LHPLLDSVLPLLPPDFVILCMVFDIGCMVCGRKTWHNPVHAREKNTVSFRREAVTLPTYKPAAPDRHPMFLEKRVYQGSSGRVYPLPFYDRIAEKPVPREWDAVHLENEFLYVMILPELGGRVHVARLNKRLRRRVSSACDQAGLGGTGRSVGQWRNRVQLAATSSSGDLMPVSIVIEREPDGAVTVWCSDHDPMARMKGMHGVCLRPGRSFLELKVRVYNRTADTQTFLWSANVATRVHERYESFFPPDAKYVADHAKRAMSTFPLCSGSYHGVDYADRARRGVPPDEVPSRYRPAANLGAKNLAWYANIPDRVGRARPTVHQTRQAPAWYPDAGYVRGGCRRRRTGTIVAPRARGSTRGASGRCDRASATGGNYEQR
jgi:hypothetical protein